MNYLSSKFNFDRTENPLSKLLMEVKKKKNYIDLTSSNPTLFFNYEFDKIKSALLEKSFFPYDPNPQGLIDARNALVKYYRQRGREMEINHFFLTSGTSEAMSFLVKAICDRESEVLLPTPGYPLYDFLLKLENVTARNYFLHPRKAKNQNKLIWEIDFTSLRKSINKNTKAIVVVEPHNPTGSRLTANDAEILKLLAKENNLVLIIDEVFSDFYEGYYSTNPFKEANCIFLNGLSKTIGLPQLKLSWIYLTGGSNFIQQMREGLELISDTYLSVNIPVQIGLDKLLETAGNIQKKIYERIQANCLMIKQLAQNENLIEYFLPDGGWHLLIKLNKDLDDEEFSYNLLKNESIYVHPGYLFDIEDGCYIVISLIISEGIFEQGIKRLIHFVNETK